jgi:hypothetical protein
LPALLAAAAFTAWAIALLAWGPQPRHPVQVARLMAQLDIDGDGTLGPSELDGRDPPGHPWRAHDLDHNDRLDARELEIVMVELSPLWLIELPAE